MSLEAKTLHLVAPVPHGLPLPEHFTVETTQVSLDSLEEGGVAIRTLVISADPYQRGQIKGAFKAGDALRGFIAGEIIASKNSAWAEGDFIGSMLPFSTVLVLKRAELEATVSWKLTGIVPREKISLGVGIFGMPGCTAYAGLVDVLRASQGETIFISAASGAVGGLVGQLAKNVYNCTVIGSCGGAEKVAILKEQFGFDHAIDYKQHSTAEELTAALKAVAPNGIDMYFENVGGAHFEAAMGSLRPGGRVAVCGVISQYNSEKPEHVPLNLGQLIYTGQRIEGFVSSSWLSGKRGVDWLGAMHQHSEEGRLQVLETVFEGIDQWPLAFQSLFTGSNKGKVVVRV